MSGKWKVASRKCPLIIAQVNDYEVGVQLGVSLEFFQFVCLEVIVWTWWSHGRLVCYYFANSSIQELFYYVLMWSPIEVKDMHF